MDNFVAEFLNLQEQSATAVQPVIRNARTEQFRDNIEVSTDLVLRGLFKIHTSTAVDSNFHQIICSMGKEWYGKSEGKLNLFGLNFTNDEQINLWVNRIEETHRKLGMPMTVGFIQLNDTKKQFNFLKSLGIASSMQKL